MNLGICGFEYQTDTIMLVFNGGGITVQSMNMKQMLHNSISYISIHYLISF